MTTLILAAYDYPYGYCAYEYDGTKLVVVEMDSCDFEALRNILYFKFKYDEGTCTPYSHALSPKEEYERAKAFADAVYKEYDEIIYIEDCEVEIIKPRCKAIASQ